MPDSAQNPEARTESRSNVEDDVQATPSTKASPGHETTEITQKDLEPARHEEEDPLRGPGITVPFPPIKTRQCNKMSYADEDGVAREIYMPKGTMRLACDLIMAKRFSDLAKFPAWDNQTYDDWEADEEKYAYLKDELGGTTGTPS